MASDLSRVNPTLRLSLAAAMELGLARGFFARGARLHCVNLLQELPGGCRANCAFCGLGRQRLARRDSFIRVDWPRRAADEIIARLRAVQGRGVVQRVCLSMITHPQALDEAVALVERLRAEVAPPISVLVAPTVLGHDGLARLRRAGAERVGVAIDCATPELFSRLRGPGVAGPHRWELYWDAYARALAVFGPGLAGVHLIHGLGESERDLARAMQRARDMGGATHLFSFFPEAGSLLQDRPQPPLGGYRRAQLARWLIDGDLAEEADFAYDDQGRIVGFGVGAAVIEAALQDGRCFMTSGCPGQSVAVACNRPFANERPSQPLRNFPFAPTPDDLALCRAQLVDYA